MVVKVVLGIVGAVFHLLLGIAVLVGLYALIKAGAGRRTSARASAGPGA